MYGGLLLFLLDCALNFTSLLNTQSYMVYLIVVGLFSIIACGLTYTIRGALSAAITFRYLGIKAGALIIGGFVFCLFAQYLQLHIIFSLVCVMLFGWGLGMLGVGKFFLLSNTQEYHLLRKLAIAGIIASLVKGIMLVLPTMWLGICLLFVLTLAAITPNRLETTEAVGISTNSPVVGMVKGMVARNWIFFVGLIISLILSVLDWKNIITGDLDAIDANLGWKLGLVAGSLTASCALLVLFRARTPHKKALQRFRSVTPIVPLICIASILLAWFFIIWEGGFNIFSAFSESIGEFFGTAPVGFSIMALSLLLVKRLTEEVKSGLSALFVFGLFLSLIITSCFLYAALQFIISWELSRVIDLSLKLGYLVIVSTYLIMSSQRKAGRIVLSHDRQIQEIGMRFSLTKREMEILSLLTQGRGAPYIAEVEFIALNTVKTHIKHLYAKIGIHNREELLDLIQEISNDQ